MKFLQALLITAGIWLIPLLAVAISPVSAQQQSLPAASPFIGLTIDEAKSKISPNVQFSITKLTDAQKKRLDDSMGEQPIPGDLNLVRISPKQTEQKFGAIVITRNDVIVFVSPLSPLERIETVINGAKGEGI